MYRDSDKEQPSLRLHEFLRDESENILEEWNRLDRLKIESARNLSREDQRNNIPRILEDIARSTEMRSQADVPEEGPKHHAEQRWQLGYSLEEVTCEYALLRSVILHKLVPRVGELAHGELLFLNQALDQAIVEGVATYVTSANQSLADERERLEVTLGSIGDGVASTDRDGRIVYLNRAAEEMIGWNLADAKGRPASEVLVTVDEARQQPLESLIRTVTRTGKQAHYPGEVLLTRRDGSQFPADEVAAPLNNTAGEFLGVVTTFRDVSRVRALTAQLGHLAAHDPLTGLPNRTLLTDRLNYELTHARRDGTSVAVLYLDLDLFKDVNDMLGHSAGDELLKLVAHRLQSCVRETDTVSRLGGDEFVILVSGFESLEALSELGATITRSLSAPYDIRSDTVDISTSVGVSVFPEDGDDAETLIKHADTAMYQAKTLGRNNAQFFAPEMNKRAAERRALQGDLRRALSADQLELHYQPQIALDTGLVTGAEALLRWHHPELGFVPPARFIPVAESSREIMITIGNWILEEACRQARTWLNEGHAPIRISVNVSIVQLQYENLLDHIDELLARFDLQADQLQLELTESILMSDVVGATDRVRALEARGIRIAVDDFGTGYSSLSYLKDLPVDELKIDQSFIRGLGANTDKAAIVQAVIRMAQSLNLRVIAEGVEEADEVAFLSLNGCEGAQGFYYGRAVNAWEFEQFYLNHHH
ncbi:putative bifunctional diguanylate cyclase/phosphodiesterase [Hydrocarboniclastica marina]|uniref:cyclic-guanylate-specific phosphodiesterase n=1 Tax=Hydrocarboniclastica marina TaxID=2259620 RepID=A0A4P7XER9_9ALTE|nr:EAL domain-containing protein [Hydrocarboniclastica marina]QCF25439.1 EAL domain-containing protein [Hydrocarboniclastica marina]